MFDESTARGLLDDSPFGRWWGFRVDHVGDRRARLTLPARPEFYRPGGVLQGGCAMTLADVTFWFAVMSATGPESAGVTLEQTSTFLGPARTDLVCDAEVLRLGGSIAYGTATVSDPDGGLIAHHTLTYVRPRPTES